MSSVVLFEFPNESKVNVHDIDFVFESAFVAKSKHALLIIKCDGIRLPFFFLSLFIDEFLYGRNYYFFRVYIFVFFIMVLSDVLLPFLGYVEDLALQERILRVISVLLALHAIKEEEVQLIRLHLHHLMVVWTSLPALRQICNLLLLQKYFLLLHHDVGWLQVAVDVARGVNVSQTLQHLNRQLLNRLNVEEQVFFHDVF